MERAKGFEPSTPCLGILIQPFFICLRLSSIGLQCLIYSLSSGIGGFRHLTPNANQSQIHVGAEGGAE